MGNQIKFKFLSLFREIFIYHHRSLEFRAKVFATIIAAKLNPDEEDFETLYDISNEIYKNDENRKRVDIDEEEGLIQRRVYDFLLYEVKNYAVNR